MDGGYPIRVKEGPGAEQHLFTIAACPVLHWPGMRQRGTTMEYVKWLDINCNACGALLNSWDVRVSKALGYKTPVCEKCIAQEYDIDHDELRARLEDFFGMRPCMGL